MSSLIPLGEHDDDILNCDNKLSDIEDNGVDGTIGTVDNGIGAADGICS